MLYYAVSNLWGGLNVMYYYLLYFCTLLFYYNICFYVFYLLVFVFVAFSLISIVMCACLVFSLSLLSVGFVLLSAGYFSSISWRVRSG
jgi:hypothetical protein